VQNVNVVTTCGFSIFYELQCEFEDTKGQSESLNRRKTDKTMAKIPKGQSESLNRRRRQHNDQKKKVLKDKQRSTKHKHTTKDRIYTNPTRSNIYKL
jgi:predicted phosphoadenosine phosphosulfate sulfurtransferase